MPWLQYQFYLTSLKQLVTSYTDIYTAIHRNWERPLLNKQVKHNVITQYTQCINVISTYVSDDCLSPFIPVFY